MILIEGTSTRLQEDTDDFLRPSRSVRYGLGFRVSERAREKESFGSRGLRGSSPGLMGLKGFSGFLFRTVGLRV